MPMGELENLNIDNIKGLPEASRRELHKLQDECIDLYEQDKADFRQDLKKINIDRVQDLLPPKYKDIKLDNILELNINDIPELSYKQKEELKKLKNELHNLHEQDIAAERLQKEEKDVNRMYELLPDKFKDISITELENLNIDNIKGLPEVSRRELHKLQDELIELEIEDKRAEEEEKEMDRVHELLPAKYKEITIEDFLGLNLDMVRLLAKVPKHELKELQNKLKELDEKDDAAERHHKKDKDVVKMHELLPDKFKDMPVGELENLDIDIIKGLPEKSRRELHKLQVELKHLDQLDQAAERHHKEDEDVNKMYE